jgi:hypothetical protein
VVQDDGHWQAHRHGDYCPVACDLVGFWRSYCQELCIESSRGVLFDPEPILEGHAVHDLCQVMRGP